MSKKQTSSDSNKVSIVIPVYNGGTFLRTSLSSICNQTYEDIEIIIINDNSDDGSAEIIREFADNDHRITVIDNDIKKGAGASRNIGIGHISGDYAVFLDADDLYEPKMIETMMRKMKDSDLDMVICRCDYCYRKSSRLLFAPYHFSVDDSVFDKDGICNVKDISDLFRSFSGWAWDKLIRTDIFRKNHICFQEIRSSNDLVFVYSCLLKCERIGLVDIPLVHHTKAGGTVSTTRENNWHCFYEALLKLKSFLKDQRLYDKYEQDFINYALHFSLWNYYSLKEPARRELFAELKDYFSELDITDNDERYFYNKNEYRQMKKILAGIYTKNTFFVRYTDKIAERIRKIGFFSFLKETMKGLISYVIININKH